MQREPNTIYTLSLSYGKDSLACLGAIEKLGLPLDKIVHAEVWATDTIPADLPPMVEFKTKADKIIKERYGIEVEHVWATKKVADGGGSCLMTACFDENVKQSTESISTVSPAKLNNGVQANSNKTCLPKLTYEDIFYRTLKPRVGGYELLMASQCGGDNGATTYSKSMQSITGFATRWAQYCTGELKRAAIRISGESQNGKKSMVYRSQTRYNQERVFFKPENDGRYKYRAIFGYSKRRTGTYRTTRKEKGHNVTACNGRLGRSVLS